MSKAPLEQVNFGFALYKSSDNWTYQYYEDEEGNRIYHGNLTYKLVFGKTWIYTITGKYSHGKKEGSWEYKAISDNKLIARYAVNYNNDLPNGKFEYFVSHGAAEKSRMTGEFQQGELFGKVEYLETGPYHYSFSLNYMKNGYPDGVWKFQNKGTIEKDYELRFLNGFLIYLSSVDQSTGERTVEKEDNIELEKYKGKVGSHNITVPESMAKVLSPHKRKFKGLDAYYEAVDCDASTFGFSIYYFNSELEKALDRINEIYKDINYQNKYLEVIYDKERNKIVKDSIENERKQQETLAKEREEQERIQKKQAEQEAEANLVAQLASLELKIDQTIALRKNAEKWENLIGVFRVCAKDKPKDKNWTLQFFTCVYRILNSNIDNNSRNQYEEKISTEAMKARSGANRAGGWFCYCDYKKLLNDCINLSADMNLVEMDSIPEFTEDEILKYNKILERRNNVMQKLYGR